MKYIITVSILISLFACRQKVDNTIFGTWHFQSKYYTGTFKIIEEQNTIKGQVLNYDDGTSKYKWNDENPKYIFQNLKYKNNQFIDGISGATKKASMSPAITIKILHQDTLEVVNNYSVEKWIRLE